MTYKFENSGGELEIYWADEQIEESPISHNDGIERNSIGIIVYPEAARAAIQTDIKQTGTPDRIEKQYSLISEGVERLHSNQS